uniref:ADP-ribosyl cyclase/cyclic ADP-ribose hydrolase n=1 Tax=Noccaea caerulescens TaxID=107243 RepID=A0A1J3JZW2_NOCCA
MFASSLLSPRQRSYDVFPSFSGHDVRRSFLSHLRCEFKRKGISTFVDDQITRSESIGHELVRAIRASRIGLVILTKKYASSSWCLDELLEIMESRNDARKKVMTIFYDIDPSDVRKQKGGFGRAFKRTCKGKTEEKKQRWTKALTDVANIAGEHSRNWPSEAAMILQIATDINNMLSFTPSRDFDHLVGMEAHIAKMTSLLRMESNKARRFIGIWGPAGIGKTTIARALYNRVSSKFQLSVFMEDVKGSYNKNDSYSSKLRLQEQFLSEILNVKDMRINHLGVAKDRLNSTKVFIVLDDVDKLGQLEALADERNWFGAGSRIIVTTEHKDILKGHGIKNIYEVNFPSGDEALQIFCQSAFKQDSPPEGFMELAAEVTKVTNHLPLGLCVLGSSLRGKRKSEWRHELKQLKASINDDIENILKVGYESLGYDKYKTIFLYIACLFNGEEEDRVIQFLESSIHDIKYGLDVLVERALVCISSYKVIKMHHLLQQMGREIVRKQSAHEPGKRQFLTDSQEINDVLNDNTGTGSVLGISFNMSESRELLVLKERAFSGMDNLQFLRFYKQWSDKARLRLHEGLDCLPLPRKLKLLHWDACPMEHFSLKFNPECLIEINMQESKLKKLWEGVPRLRSLKKMKLSDSTSLEELPDLSEATNLEHLDMKNCHSLLNLPDSIWKLSKLDFLDLEACTNLEPLPENYALDSLTTLNISNCPKLEDFPEISSHIKYLNLSFTAIPDVPPSFDYWDCLHTLNMNGCENVTEFPPVPYTVSELYLNSTGIQEVPPWVSDLHGLTKLMMSNCTKLRKISPRIFQLGQLEVLDFSGCVNVKKFPAEIFQSFSLRHGLKLSLSLNNIGKNSLPRFTPEETHDFPLILSLNGNDFESITHHIVRQVRCLYLWNCMSLRWLPELPVSLSELHANNCVALESLSPPLRSSHASKLIVKLANCWKLDQQARKLVVEEWSCGYAVLTGSKVPDYFTHRAIGSSLTIDLDPMEVYESLRFKACVVVLLSHELDLVSYRNFEISCYVRGRHSTTVYKWPMIDAGYWLMENHLFILNSYFTLEEDNIPESEMLFDFKCLEMEEYPETVSSIILGCGVKFLEPCSCEYDSKAHPELSTIALEDNESNNIGETSRSKKLKRRSKKSSVAEGPERTSKNRRIK